MNERIDDLSLNPASLDIRSSSLTTLDQALAYVRSIHGADAKKSEEYVREVFRLAPESGYSPEILIAQWDLETGTGTEHPWLTRLNPGGIGITDGGDSGYSWPTPAAAAQGQSVHLSAYVDGYNRGLRRYLEQDPRYALVLHTDWAGSVKTVADLTGKWATDPLYGPKIAERLERLRGFHPAPSPTTPSRPVPALDVHWIGTENYGQRGRGQQPIFLVHHITDDMVLDHVVGWFRKRGSNASSHFVVDRDGSIYQFVRTVHYAWTNGDYYIGDDPTPSNIVARHDIPLLNHAIDECMNNDWNLNGHCISIEYVGTPATPPSDAQYDAGIAIARYCLALYPTMSPHRYGQLRHADIDPVNRKYCPGNKFQLERIITAIGGDPQRLSA